MAIAICRNHLIERLPARLHPPHTPGRWEMGAAIFPAVSSAAASSGSVVRVWKPRQADKQTQQQYKYVLLRGGRRLRWTAGHVGASKWHAASRLFLGECLSDAKQLSEAFFYTLGTAAHWLKMTLTCSHVILHQVVTDQKRRARCTCRSQHIPD